MRKKTLLLLAFGGSLLFGEATGQAVWRIEGPAVSSGTDKSLTQIYISGDMQFSSNAASTAAMTIDNSRVMLTGNLLNDVANGVTGGTLFVSPSPGTDGVLEFCGSSAQSVTTSGTTHTGSPSKLYNYINFPGIEINNSSHVTLDSRLGAKTGDITLSKGWLILDSSLARAGVDGDNLLNENDESVLAHLLVGGSIDYKESTWASKADANERGFIQVNLQIPNEISLPAESGQSIVGFGIPFKEMRNDYFMFNTLLEPKAGYTDGSGFLANEPLTNPATTMTPGKGYVVGIDLRGTDPEEYEPLEDYEDVIDFSKRATDGYRFNRHAYALLGDGTSNPNQLFGTDPTSEAYTSEKLNTDDIEVLLSPGYNYLANPYTCPLNIDKLLGNNEASAWGIVSDAVTAKPQMRNHVWILSPNSIAKSSPNGDPRQSRYTYAYQVAAKTGGTYVDPGNTSGVTAIAPLQMFVIRSYSTATTITIPKSERVMGSARFLRSSAGKYEPRRDDFIIEFRDGLSRTSDRASIVFRTEEELSSNPNYVDVERLESTSGESGNGTRSASGGDFAQNLASQIYTKDASGKALTVRFLPLEEAGQVVLYHIPPCEPQPLSILGLRLDTKDRVGRLWLVDSKYDTRVELTPETLYETYSEPTDSHERFALRFSTETTSIEPAGPVSGNIYAYADPVSRSIYACGFSGEDYGMAVSLYDVNGRLVSRKTADGEKMLLHEDCIPGVYIVKVNTAVPKAFKLIVK